ncbi:MAG: SRPBCC family protein [Flavobacteriales bacterium]|nr:SRPBCC family protein [Flavobacteriales bacterium]
MAKTTISREIEIKASKEAVWKSLADFGNICHAFPSVSSSQITSEQTEGIGTTRHCDFVRMDATIEERITDWKEGEYLKLEAYDWNNMPGLKSLEAEFSVYEREGNTMLRASIHYSMKTIVYDILNSLMMRRLNIQYWDGLLAGHKRLIETGEHVTRETRLDLTQVEAC